MVSVRVIETYKQSLKTYLRFLKEKKNIEDELVSFEAFTRDYVKEFIIWLKGQGASTRTINLRITSIRSFLKYCGQEDFELRGIYESVCQIQKLKEEKHPILYLQPEATAAILSAYDMNTQKHRRNRMILICFTCSRNMACFVATYTAPTRKSAWKKSLTGKSGVPRS